MKKQWGIVVAIILVLMIALFAVMNVEVVPVNFGFTMVSWPLIMVILGSLFIGALITVLIATNSAFKTKKQIKNYETELSKANQTKQSEIDNVRMEYEQKLNDQDAKIIEQENKINSLEKELIDRMTHGPSTNK